MTRTIKSTIIIVDFIVLINLKEVKIFMLWIDEAWTKTVNKISSTSDRIKDSIPYISIDGRYNDKSVDPGWWTNGFWSGILWYMYKETKDEKFARYSEGNEKLMDTVLHNYDRMDHDAGFMWMLSSVADYRITGNDQSRRHGMLAASILASRFNLKGKFIRAWNSKDGQPDKAGWAIIDCMMNLPILYWASDMINDPRFKYIAMEHADTVMKDFVRPDGSLKHIVMFNPETGEMVDSMGGQGYDKDSSWSRGTAWALYGFTLSYWFTKEQRYLDTAKKVANFFIASLPEDYVPFADFKAPKESNINKDTSAGACAASGLMLLSTLVSDNEKDIYERPAHKILKALYENHGAWNEDEEALLKNGCVRYHSKDEANVPLIYGDYFFVEALAQAKGMESLFTYPIKK